MSIEEAQALLSPSGAPPRPSHKKGKGKGLRDYPERGKTPSGSSPLAAPKEASKKKAPKATEKQMDRLLWFCDVMTTCAVQAVQKDPRAPQEAHWLEDLKAVDREVTQEYGDAIAPHVTLVAFIGLWSSFLAYRFLPADGIISKFNIDRLMPKANGAAEPLKVPKL